MVKIELQNYPQTRITTYSNHKLIYLLFSLVIISSVISKIFKLFRRIALDKPHSPTQHRSLRHQKRHNRLTMRRPASITDKQQHISSDQVKNNDIDKRRRAAEHGRRHDVVEQQHIDVGRTGSSERGHGQQLPEPAIQMPRKQHRAALFAHYHRRAPREPQEGRCKREHGYE